MTIKFGKVPSTLYRTACMSEHLSLTVEERYLNI